jgi:hypothetical protein
LPKVVAPRPGKAPRLYRARVAYGMILCFNSSRGDCKSKFIDFCSCIFLIL